jgi:hypothetical protein
MYVWEDVEFMVERSAMNLCRTHQRLVIEQRFLSDQREPE